MKRLPTSLSCPFLLSCTFTWPVPVSGTGEQVPVDDESRLRDGTEPAVFVPKVAKQHDVFAGVIAFGVLVSARARF